MSAIPRANTPSAVEAAGEDLATGAGSVSPTIVELHHGDCLDGMKAMPDESVNVVVTSPPYNLGIEYGTYRDDQRRDQYLEWCGQWGRELRRVLKPKGSLFLNVGGSPSNPLLPHQLVMLFSEFLCLQNTIHWVKSITLDDGDGEIVSKGHFRPISSGRFVNDCHEYVFHLTKDGKVPIDRLAIGVPYADKSNIARWSHTDGADVRCRGNNWFIPYETIRSRDQQRPHPATFPPRLAEMCIKLHGQERDLAVLDPFVGIGSAAGAAQACGVARFIGFDIDEGYLAVAAERTGASIHEQLQSTIPSSTHK